jgi:hypothetical protein
MLLEAGDMAGALAEVRVGTAVLRGRLCRLDSPALRARLRQAAAAGGRYLVPAQPQLPAAVMEPAAVSASPAATGVEERVTVGVLEGQASDVDAVALGD